MNQEQDSGFFILAIDDGMALFLSSFKLMNFKLKNDGERVSWSDSTYSGKLLAKATGLSERSISKYFDIASTLGMIKADGTVHPTAERYIKALINAKISKIN